jgi:hypothetical protein
MFFVPPAGPSSVGDRFTFPRALPMPKITASSFRYVRRVKGGRWQGRVWVGYEYGYLSLGCHDTPLEASRAVVAFLREHLTPFLRDGILPPRCLPKYVRVGPPVMDPHDRDRRIGETYTAWGKLFGRMVRVGTFPTPAEAHAAFVAKADAMFGVGWARKAVEAMQRRKDFRALQARRVVPTRPPCSRQAAENLDRRARRLAALVAPILADAPDLDRHQLRAALNAAHNLRPSLATIEATVAFIRAGCPAKAPPRPRSPAKVSAQPQRCTKASAVVAAVRPIMAESPAISPASILKKLQVAGFAGHLSIGTVRRAHQAIRGEQLRREYGPAVAAKLAEDAATPNPFGLPRPPLTPADALMGVMLERQRDEQMATGPDASANGDGCNHGTTEIRPSSQVVPRYTDRGTGSGRVYGRPEWFASACGNTMHGPGVLLACPSSPSRSQSPSLFTRARTTCAEPSRA